MHYKRWRAGTPINAPVRGVDPPAPKGTCSIDGCDATVLAVSLCRHHYHRKRKYGDPLIGPAPLPKFNSTEERFWSKVDKSGDCWEWIGSFYKDGYGSFNIRRNGRKTSIRAHRMAYLLTTGEDLPPEIVVDHMCFNIKCVNPAHLRPATRAQNAENRRGAQKNSKSGVRGVWWSKQHQKLEAVVMQGRKRHYCGLFTDIKEAEKAVIAKRNELFTHNLLDRRTG